MMRDIFMYHLLCLNIKQNPSDEMIRQCLYHEFWKTTKDIFGCTWSETSYVAVIPPTTSRFFAYFYTM